MENKFVTLCMLMFASSLHNNINAMRHMNPHETMSNQTHRDFFRANSEKDLRAKINTSTLYTNRTDTLVQTNDMPMTKKSVLEALQPQINQIFKDSGINDLRIQYANSDIGKQIDTQIVKINQWIDKQIDIILGERNLLPNDQMQTRLNQIKNILHKSLSDLSQIIRFKKRYPNNRSKKTEDSPLSEKLPAQEYSQGDYVEVSPPRSGWLEPKTIRLDQNAKQGDIIKLTDFFGNEKEYTIQRKGREQDAQDEGLDLENSSSWDDVSDPVDASDPVDEHIN